LFHLLQAGPIPSPKFPADVSAAATVFSVMFCFGAVADQPMSGIDMAYFGNDGMRWFTRSRCQYPSSALYADDVRNYSWLRTSTSRGSHTRNVVPVPGSL